MSIEANPNNDLIGDIDAQNWAKRFVEVAQNEPRIATDPGTMISWFASAIMAGLDYTTTMVEQVDPAGDIDTLRKLKAEPDPRTIAEMIAQEGGPDGGFDEGIVQAVSESSEGWVAVDCGDWGTSVRVPEGKEIKPGDKLRIYGGFGQPHYGYSINDEVWDYLTPWQRFAKRMEMLAEMDRDQRERFAVEKEQLDADVAALPAPLKKRIERFREEDPEFRIKSESYEMAACRDAPKIAKAIARENDWTLSEDLAATGIDEEVIQGKVQHFYDLSSDYQREMVPDLDKGHSGNTFGGAVKLAFGLLLGREL